VTAANDSGQGILDRTILFSRTKLFQLLQQVLWKAARKE
jgi:hypothetical protein